MNISQFESELIGRLSDTVLSNSNINGELKYDGVIYESDDLKGIDSEKLYDALKLFCRVIEDNNNVHSILLTSYIKEEDNVDAVYAALNTDIYDIYVQKMSPRIEPIKGSNNFSIGLTIKQTYTDKYPNVNKEINNIIGEVNDCICMQLTPNDKHDFGNGNSIISEASDNINIIKTVLIAKSINMRVVITENVNSVGRLREIMLSSNIIHDDDTISSTLISLQYAVDKPLSEMLKRNNVDVPNSGQDNIKFKRYSVDKDTLNNIDKLDDDVWAEKVRSEIELCNIKNTLSAYLEKINSIDSKFSPYNILMTKFYSSITNDNNSNDEFIVDIDELISWAIANKYTRCLKVIFKFPLFAYKRLLSGHVITFEILVKIIDFVIDSYYKYDISIDNDKMINLIKTSSSLDMTEIAENTICSPNKHDSESVINGITQLSDELVTYLPDNAPHAKYLIMSVIIAIIHLFQEIKSSINDGEYNYDELTYDNLFTEEEKSIILSEND